jgi:hypothetical protein
MESQKSDSSAYLRLCYSLRYWQKGVNLKQKASQNMQTLSVFKILIFGLRQFISIPTTREEVQ